MASRTAVIGSSTGLHARPAALFTQAVAATGADVEISVAGGEPVDASSVLEVMTLGAKKGDEVTLTTEAEDGEKVLEDLVAILESDLDAQ